MIERVLLVGMSLMLASCFSTPLSPHKIDVQQGNYVDQDMVAKLKPGMTRSQVRFVLGTPLVADPFHGNRWDYVYRMQKNGGLPEERKITIVFEDDKLARVDGDIVPGDVAEDAKPKVSKAAPPRSLTGAADPAKKAEERPLKEKVEALIAEKEAQGKDDSELRKSLAKLLGVEERDISDLPRAKAVSGREKAPPEPRQAKSDLPKSQKVSAQKKVVKAKSEEKPQAAGEEPGKGIRASGFSADVLSALGVRYEGDGKGSEQEAEVEETDDEGQPAKKRKTARKSGLKADGLSADILRTLGVGFEGDDSENAPEDDEEVAEGGEKPAKEEKAGVLDELKNAEGKSVKQQLSEKFGIGGDDEKKKRGDAEDVSGGEEVAGKPTFMDDMRTVIGLGPAEKGTSGKSEKLAKKSAREDVEEGDVEEEQDETPEKPTFWEDVRTIIGLD